MAKKNNGNGSNGNGGAPEEAHAVAPTSAPYDGELQEAIARGQVPAELPDQPEEAIPPDQQGQSASGANEKPIASMSTDELKTSWASLRGEIDEIEARADDRRTALRVVEQELCERYKKVADAQKVEPVVMIAGRRMKVKARQERVGGGLGFVDAPIRPVIEL